MLGRVFGRGGKAKPPLSLRLSGVVAMAAAEKLAVLNTQDYFRSRVERADLVVFDRIMARAGGQPPREGDER